MVMKVKKLNPDAKLPVALTDGSAGYDICALEKVSLVKGAKPTLVHTGLSIEVESDKPVAILLMERSSMGKRGINLSNSVGLIDQDYRGEYLLCMQNTCGSDIEIINAGDRVAQLVIVPIEKPGVVEVEELSDTRRGTGGFGSTGK